MTHASARSTESPSTPVSCPAELVMVMRRSVDAAHAVDGDLFDQHLAGEGFLLRDLPVAGRELGVRRGQLGTGLGHVLSWSMAGRAGADMVWNTLVARCASSTSSERPGETTGTTDVPSGPRRSP